MAYYASIFDKKAEVTITLACNCTTVALKTEAYAKTDKVIYQDLEYSVVSTKTSKGKDYTKPSAGKIFLGVTVNAKNVSLKDQIEVTDYNWKVVDAQGVQYSSSFWNPWETSAFSSQNLEVNANVSFFLVFEVPSTSKWFLVYNGNMMSSSKKFSILLN